MRIAYLVNQYPMVSHSFIRREIQALEGLGVAVERIALRGDSGTLVDAGDSGERARTAYVLQAGMARLACCGLATLLRRPAGCMRAGLAALRMARKSLRPFYIHAIYLVEACYVAKLCAAAGADHLHAHFGTNSAEIAMLASLVSGIGYSFTVHGPDEFDQAESIGLGEKIRHSAFVVAVSSYGRGQLFRWTQAADWTKIKVVHCGIEPAFHQDGADVRRQRRQLACVGRLSEQKGQLLLLQAMGLLLGRGVEFELVLAGDGELRRQIEADVVRLGLQGRVQVTGWVSSAEVRAILLSSRGLVLPSFAEGLPVVIMEAMSLRRPVLTTYIAGIPELVLSGSNGWLVPSGSVGELADAIEKFLAMPDAELARMGEAARARVLERHDIAVEAAKIAAHFSAAIAARARPC